MKPLDYDKLVVTKAALEVVIKKASTDPKFVEALAPQGMQIIASSPDEMAQALREARRVAVPGAEVFIATWGAAQTAVRRPQ